MLTKRIFLYFKNAKIIVIIIGKNSNIYIVNMAIQLHGKVTEMTNILCDLFVL